MRSPAYRRRLLAVLLVTLAFNTKDRLLFGITLQSIKVDLALSDTQMGLLTGLAFALFYAVMGIPIARWADRGNRVRIIALSTAAWSAGVALCGLAGSFIQLLVTRIAVAIGEAGTVPAAHSLLADHFERAERPRAAAIFKMGIPLSALIGYFLGGWLNEIYGWRMTFIILGLPGLALAAITWLTLVEPRLNAASAPSHFARRDARAGQTTLKEVSTWLWSNRTFRNLLLGYSVMSLFSNGVAQWTPAFFMRTHGMGTGELGTWLTLIYGGLGLAATYYGGAWASRFAADNEALQLRIVSVAYVVFGIVSCGIYLSPGPHLAIALSGIAALGAFAVAGPLFATIQTLVPERMRATSIAIVLLAVSLIGLGLGPLSVGMLSDGYRSWAGEESLRFALLTLCPGYLWAAWHFRKASRTVASDLAAIPGAA